MGTLRSAGKKLEVMAQVMNRSGQHIIVVGGGIAGLAAAWRLSRSHTARVTVIEGEAVVFSRASGSNAGIFRPLELDPLLVELAARSHALLGALQEDSSSPLLRSNGLWMLSHDSAELEHMARNARDAGFSCEIATAHDLVARVPGLSLADRAEGVGCAQGGVLDAHEIGQALSRALVRAGVEIRRSDRVERLTTGSQGQCTGVRLAAGQELEAEAVVLCAGASVGLLTLEVGAPLPLLPLQRHLAILEGPHGLHRDSPVIWQTDPEVYFRPESGGVLVSPCDETPVQKSSPNAQLSALFPLTERLLSVYPSLAEGRVRRFWACVRTKTPDNRPLIGEAPYVSGLYYLAGLGGFGMSCGLGAGAWLAEGLLQGQARPAVDPRRFYLPFFSGETSSSSNTRKAGV